MHIRSLLLDLDGVFHVGDRLLHGAVEFLAFVRKKKLPFRIVTNTTTRSRASLVERMRRMGLPLEPGDLITAPRAAALYLRELGRPQCRLVVAESTRADFEDVRHNENDPEVIVLGDIEDQLSYTLLNSIFNQMMSGAQLIALHKGRFWEAGGGLKVDLGLFVAGLEYTTGKTATVIGKPSPTIFRMALEDMEASAAECAMVGDDPINDVAGAQAAGLRGILIKTGKFRAEHDLPSGVKPDAVVEDLMELQRLIERGFESATRGGSST